MLYKLYLTKDEAKGLSVSTKRAKQILAEKKWTVHNIFIGTTKGTTKKVALCEGDELKHIITRKAYIAHLCPTLYAL